MSWWSYGLILALAGVTAVVLVIDLVRDRAAQDSHFLALGILELGVLAQLVGGCVALARTDRAVDGVVFVSYLATVALAPIAGALLALSERSRVGTTLLLLAVATVAGMEIRLWDVWGGAGA